VNKSDSKYIIVLITITLTFLFVNYTALASIVSYTTDADGITCTLDKGFMKVKICKEDVVEVKYTSLTALSQKTSLVVTNLWTSQPQFQVTENSTEIIISTGKLKIKLTKLTNSIQYIELNGALILAEDDSVGKKMTAATIAGINT
jgi:alpha-D-xyloside xylohydrolase